MSSFRQKITDLTGIGYTYEQAIEMIRYASYPLNSFVAYECKAESDGRISRSANQVEFLPKDIDIHVFVQTNSDPVNVVSQLRKLADMIEKIQ